MKIVAIHERTIPLRSDIENAYISFSEMDTSLVAVVTDVRRDGQRVVGYGFNSNGRYSAAGILRSRMIPRVLAAEPAELVDDEGGNLDPARIWAVAMRNEKPGGHGDRSVAVSALDMAVFDAMAKIEEKPLCRLIAERYGDGAPEADVSVYAAGGYYYPGKDVEALKQELRAYRELGYREMKIKIGAAPLENDLRRIDAALEVVEDGACLAVDANGRFDVETAVAYAEALAPMGLRWYEEPCDPLDYAGLSDVAATYEPPLATGENLFSWLDGRNLLRHGGLRPDRDVVQLDPALCGGLVEYLRFIDALRATGWSARRCIPHGGHQFGLHVAAGLKLGGNESYPGVFEPIGGFDDDAVVRDGRIEIGGDVGIGIERKRDLYAHFQEMLA
jgi:L-alanine-DL-glutamate epimerase-like enolase superfamily enzyme